jgi:hypothetical protein
MNDEVLLSSTLQHLREAVCRARELGHDARVADLERIADDYEAALAAADDHEQ